MVFLPVSIMFRLYNFQLWFAQLIRIPFLRCRDDVASNSTFTLEDSAICLTSEQSTVDADIDRDDGSVLDVYLVRRCSLPPFIFKDASNKRLFVSCLSWALQ